MKPIPTDLELLNAIYYRYYETFARYSDDESSRSSKIFVPIDIDQIANSMKIDSDIIFGRLYYHLEEKYGYKQEGSGSTVHFFAMAVGKDHHCINFPYAASVLADLRNENRKFQISTSIACLLFLYPWYLFF